MPKEYATLKEVMDKYDKTYVQVRYATETNRLIGEKVGWQWIYPREHLPDVWPSTKRDNKRQNGVSIN